MGIRSSEFWEFTPNEWNALSKIYRNQLERLDTQFASIRKMLYEIHKKPEAPSYGLGHFRLIEGEEETDEDIALSIESQMQGLIDG